MRYTLAAAVAVFLLSACATPSPYPRKGSAEQRALFERGQVAQAASEQRLFAQAGFEPIADVAAAGRDVRRALFLDPYMFLPVPGVEVERHSDGKVTLTVIGPVQRHEPSVVRAAAWQGLADIEANLFVPLQYVPWDPPVLPTPPPPICHGWGVLFASSDAGSPANAGWAQCGGSRGPSLDYAVEMARLAISTRPDCSFDASSPFWSFNRCFGPRPDPEPSVPPTRQQNP